MSRTSKWQPEVDIFSLFSTLIRQIRTPGVETKAFKFTVWDRSFPFISETSNLRLLFMTSRTSALYLLQLAIFDCEQSLFSQSSQGLAGLERAKLPRGELERERPHSSFHSAGSVFFVRIARFSRSRDHPEGPLAV